MEKKINHLETLRDPRPKKHYKQKGILTLFTDMKKDCIIRNILLNNIFS